MIWEWVKTKQRNLIKKKVGKHPDADGLVWKSGTLKSTGLSSSYNIETGNFGIPSGKLTELWKITMFNGKIHYKWSFSIAMLNYQRVQVPHSKTHPPWSYCCVSHCIPIEYPHYIPIKPYQTPLTQLMPAWGFSCETTGHEILSEHDLHSWGGSIYAMNSNPKGRCRKYWRETQFHHVIKFTSSNYHIFSIIYLCSETMISSNKNVHVRHGCLLVALEGAITGPSFSNDLGKASNWSPRIGHKTNIHGQNLHFHG